ncbi:hypothetical protein DFS34DRAFT_308490 [Phlyctochytrium arcticum]|nr:hypothetical protein DFS34DRAFT_308490 [Phlyctochytrium arcticum]
MDLNKYTQFTRNNVKFYTNKSKGNAVLERMLEICEDDLNKYTQFTRNNVKFYTNKSKGNAVLERMLEICEDDEYIIAHCRTYVNKRGDSQLYSEYAAVTKEKLEGLLKSDNQLFEIMHPDRKQKVPFDVELVGTEDPIIEVQNLISTHFPQCKMNIL